MEKHYARGKRSIVLTTLNVDPVDTSDFCRFESNLLWVELPKNGKNYYIKHQLFSLAPGDNVCLVWHAYFHYFQGKQLLNLTDWAMQTCKTPSDIPEHQGDVVCLQL